MRDSINTLALFWEGGHVCIGEGDTKQKEIEGGYLGEHGERHLALSFATHLKFRHTFICSLQP